VNVAALPRWAIALLAFILFAVVPAVSHLLDDPADTEAAQATADDKADATAQARRVARLGDAP
jgi:hypothetical protein